MNRKFFRTHGTDLKLAAYVAGSILAIYVSPVFGAMLAVFAGAALFRHEAKAKVAFLRKYNLFVFGPERRKALLDRIGEVGGIRKMLQDRGLTAQVSNLDGHLDILEAVAIGDFAGTDETIDLGSRLASGGSNVIEQYDVLAERLRASNSSAADVIAKATATIRSTFPALRAAIAKAIADYKSARAEANANKAAALEPINADIAETSNAIARLGAVDLLEAAA